MKILLATDLSHANDSAVTFVKKAPWPKGSTLRLITAIEPYAAFAGLAPEAIVQFDDLAESELRKGLAKLATSLERTGLTIEHDVVLGRPADEIVAEARSFGAHLVIVGNRGHGPFEATLLGSTSSEVVDRSPCPVLVARKGTWGKIVIATDGSPGARAAIAFIKKLPVFKGATAHVISAVDVPLPWTAGMEPQIAGAPAIDAYNQLAATLKEQANKDVAAAQRALAETEIKATSKTREGPASAQIVAEAEEWGADLIVVGSRGLSGLARLVLGSVAKSVLTHAHCSVLVVHQPHAGEKEHTA